jgi:two-component system osmolarity sensor histidine kinase EnvZ
MPPNLLTGLLEDALVERLPRGRSDLRWGRQGQTTLWVKMPLAGEEYWLVVPKVQLDTRPLTTVELTTLTALLSLAAAALIQRRINRPLVRLVQAANRIARGESVPHLSERAPEEIAALTRAFNQMSAGLAQIDAERTVMLAGVSHDLRTPLAKMRLAIEMLSRDGEPTLIDSMLRSAVEMDAIVDQFHEFARLASVDARNRIDLNRLVRDCAESYQAYGHGVQLDLQELPPVSAHPQSITRALTNLIGNALRYAGPPVLVQSRCVDGAIHVSVLDSGPGIDECEIESLKRPFTRGRRSTGISGAGLGLAIVERIARFHGGALALLRREGGGLHARIELPASSSPKALERRRESP